MKKCVFCASLEDHKEIDRSFKVDVVYKVALVRHSKKLEKKGYFGRSTDYNVKGIGFKLKYCPECGRKINE